MTMLEQFAGREEAMKRATHMVSQYQQWTKLEETPAGGQNSAGKYVQAAAAAGTLENAMRDEMTAWLARWMV